MATIHTLNKSISEMSEDELRNRMLELRKSRRTSKKPGRKATKNKQSDPTALLANMSKEDRDKLIKQLAEME
jgi:hypothetical protein